MGSTYTHQETSKALDNVVRSLSVIHRNVIGRALVSRPEGVLLFSRLQAVFNMRFEDRVEQMIHEIIINHALASEKVGPGGFDECIELLLRKFLPAWPMTPSDGVTPILGDDLVPGTAVPKADDIDWILERYLSQAGCMIEAMLRQALALAGFTGRIVVEKTPAVHSVELVRGYSFDQAPAWPINVRLERPKVVCIDGYVETVSELHHLLEAASETKEALLVFVRGLSDDVKHTLRVNYDRGSLRLVPIVVRFDVEGINVINDVSVVTGADLVSSHKGDLISNVSLSTAPVVDEAVINPSRVTVTHRSTRRAVEAHVGFLREKRATAQNDDVGKLFDMRIRSLSPNQVVIRIPDDRDFVVIAQSIDYALRAIRSLVEHGTVTIAGQKSLVTTVSAARAHSNRCYETLSSLGACITV